MIAVLQKELDKIERNTKTIVENASMTKSSLSQQVQVMCDVQSDTATELAFV